MSLFSSSNQKIPLLKLLTIVTIIGILVSNAIGMNSSFRQSSFQTAVEQNTRKSAGYKACYAEFKLNHPRAKNTIVYRLHIGN